MEQQLAWFETLYDTYGDAIFRHLYYQLGDRERAKELTQEVFMRTWQHVAAGKAIEHERAFLYRIAHNLFVNEIRTDKRTRSLETLVTEAGFDLADEHADTSEVATAGELLRHMGELKDSYREVLVMRYIDDLPVVEIARLLGESETNISMRINRALGKLRERYNQKPTT